MAMRDVNVFEKHVEKIVIGAAGAGALFMIYLALQPVTVPPPAGLHEPVTAAGPHGVEKVIHDALGDPINVTTPEQAAQLAKKTDRTVEESMALIKYMGKPPVRMPDYPQVYKDLAGMRPLDPALVNATVPRIGPANISPQQIIGPRVDEKFALVPPEPVAPENVTATATQYMVTTMDPAIIPNPLPEGAVLPTVEKKVVIIQGWVPVGRMMQEILEEKDPKAKLQPDQQRVVIQDIKVMRREILPSGAKTGWTEVKEPKGETPVQPVLWRALPDDGLPGAMDSLDAQFKQIVIPDFYRDAHGAVFIPPILNQPIPDKIATETKELQAAIDAARGGYMMSGRGAAAGAGTGSGTTTALPNDPQQIRQLAVVPFTFWDDTVEPGHTYGYQVSVEFANPVYGWSHGLKDPADKSRTALVAKPVDLTVRVNADVEFFVSNSSQGAGQVDVRIFKQSAGNWYHTDVSIPVGSRVAGRIVRSGTPIDVDTHYLVVDMKASNQAGGAASVHVVLSDPQGNLVTRDSDIDWRSPDQQKLLDLSKQAASTTEPATQPAGMTMGSPTGNTRGNPMSMGSPTGSTPARGTPMSQGSATGSTPRGTTTRSIRVQPGR